MQGHSLNSLAAATMSMNFRTVLMPICFQTWSSEFHPMNSLKSIQFIPFFDLRSRVKFYYLLSRTLPDSVEKKSFLGRMNLHIKNQLYSVNLFLFLKKGLPKYRKREQTGSCLSTDDFCLAGIFCYHISDFYLYELISGYFNFLWLKNREEEMVFSRLSEGFCVWIHLFLRN